jgi:hypothetical protein
MVTSTSLTQALVIAQLCVSIVTLMGVVFMAGRLFERVRIIGRHMDEIKTALFGDKGDGGAFVRRAEMIVLKEQADDEHEEFRRRLGLLEEHR